MGVNIQIKGGNGSKPVEVTSGGELVVAPKSYDQTKFQNMTVVDTAYSFYNPEPLKQFVIKSIIVFGDRNINDTNSTIVEIYEADSPDSTTVDKILLQFGIGKLQTLPIIPLNILVNEGVWINAKTDDNNILLTITGNFISLV